MIRKNTIVSLADYAEKAKTSKPETEDVEDSSTDISYTTTLEPDLVIREYDYRKTPVEINENMRVKVTTKGRHGKTFLANLTGKDWIDRRSFFNAMCKYTANANLTLKNEDLLKIKTRLYDNSEIKTIYACAGQQDDKFVGANYYYDCKLWRIFLVDEKENTMTSQSENYLLDSENTCKPMLYPAKEPELLVLKRFFLTLKNTFDDSAVLLCVGGAIAICYWDIFQKIVQGHPTIFFVGEHQSGKSTLLSLISAIFGLVNTSNCISGTSTPFAITQQMSSRLNIPVFLEEFSAENLTKSEQMVKNFYSGLTRMRGRREGVDEFKVFTSFVATSNDFFPNPSGQLLSRILFANMRKGQFDLENFPYFDIEKRKELSQILPIFLRFREKIEVIYNIVFSELEKIIPNKGRHVSNLAISSSIFYIVNLIMGKEVFDWRKMSQDYDSIYHKYLDSEVKSSDVVMNNLIRMFETSRLIYDYDYKIVGHTILRLNINRYIEKYNAENPTKIMTAKQFRLAVANDKRFDTNSVPSGNVRRAIAINISEQEYLLELIRSKHVLSAYRDE